MPEERGREGGREREREKKERGDREQYRVKRSTCMWCREKKREGE